MLVSCFVVLSCSISSPSAILAAEYGVASDLADTVILPLASGFDVIDPGNAVRRKTGDQAGDSGSSKHRDTSCLGFFKDKLRVDLNDRA